MRHYQQQRRRKRADDDADPVWRRLLTLCLVRLIDPICFSQIFPCINDMLLDMRFVGRNAPERAGFYSGLIESVRFLYSLRVSYVIPRVRLYDPGGSVWS